MSALRRLRASGGSLAVALPKLFCSRMGVGRNDVVRVIQPYSDLILVEREDAEPAGPTSPEFRVLVWATEEKAFEALDGVWGGHAPPGPMMCSMCRHWEATRVYVSIGVCDPCRHELAAAYGFRRRPRAVE